MGSFDRVATFGDPPPLMVLTGGDPFRRPDLVDLVAHGAQRGLSVSLTPSGTAGVTQTRLREVQHQEDGTEEYEYRRSGRRVPGAKEKP